eukprot:SAG25_NODE_6993_length_513_cov_0.939614_1_plen_49_part_01
MPSQRRVTVWIGNAKPLGIYTFTEYASSWTSILPWRLPTQPKEITPPGH